MLKLYYLYLMCFFMLIVAPLPVDAGVFNVDYWEEGNLAASRSLETAYVNYNSSAMILYTRLDVRMLNGTYCYVELLINDEPLVLKGYDSAHNEQEHMAFDVLVPNGSTYRLTNVNNMCSAVYISGWYEIYTSTEEDMYSTFYPNAWDLVILLLAVIAFSQLIYLIDLLITKYLKIKQ